LTRRRGKHATNGIGKRLGKVQVKRAIKIDDNLNRNDWHDA
jgi:hypothetical protein